MQPLLFCIDFERKFLGQLFFFNHKIKLGKQGIIWEIWYILIGLENKGKEGIKDMKVDLVKKGTVLTAQMQGEIDHHAAAEIRTKVDAYITGSNVEYLVLDFSQVSFMDSSGIGMVMGRYQNMKRLGGELCIVGVQSSVKRILDMSGLTGIIPLYPNQEAFLEVVK